CSGDVNAGVVDEDVETAELPYRAVDQRAHGRFAGYIRLDEQALAAALIDFGDGRSDGVPFVILPPPRLLLDVGDDDASALGSEEEGDPASDAGAAAGDNGNTIP